MSYFNWQRQRRFPAKKDKKEEKYREKEPKGLQKKRQKIMNVSEAFRKLELDQNANPSEDDIKKQFRKLAALYHPDKNKDPGAEQKSKEISEAYNTIKNAKDSQGNYVSASSVGDVHFQGMDDFFENFVVNFNGPFRRAQDFRRSQPVELNVVISFAESVLGCTKKIDIEKDARCEICYGKGFKLKDNCKVCNGKGFIIQEEQFDKQKLKVKTQCNSCSGHGKHKENCSDCASSGVKKSKLSLDVKLPGGIVTGNKIRLAGQGNYIKLNGTDFYEDAFLTISVIKEHNMTLLGLDVISNIEITFLDALKGAIKDVKTVNGDARLTIPGKSRDKDRISISGAGANGKGNHIFILDIKYPNDNTIDKMIEIMEKELV
jgi:molecular chaperone DnaJ